MHKIYNQYKTITATSIEILEKRVNDAMHSELMFWQPLGGVFVDSNDDYQNFYYQTMVR